MLSIRATKVLLSTPMSGFYYVLAYLSISKRMASLPLYVLFL